jgi:hypothetical protein
MVIQGWPGGARQARRAQVGGRAPGTSKLRHALAHPRRPLTAAAKIWS